MRSAEALVLPIALLAAVIAGACASQTKLTSTDQSALQASQRDNAAIILRSDAGMPSADRALAKGAFCAVDGVLWRAGTPRVDAGLTCR